MLQARLRVIGGKHDGHVIPLSQRKFLIGRERDCQLRTGSELISRHHCVFTVDEYALRLRDMGSTNGTFVNGERIRGEVMLKSGDEVHVGKLAFAVDVAVGAAVPATDAPEVPSGGDFVFANPPDADTTGETSFEIPVEPEPADVETGDTVVVANADTDVIPVYNPPDQQPPYPQAPGYYPQQPFYDPYQQQPGYYPPQQGQYPHPGYYPQYPQGQYPPQYGGGYPPQQPGYYPPQGQYPYPQQPAAPQTPAGSQGQSSGKSGVDPIPVRLPDPEQTGAVDAPPPAAKPGQNAANPAEKTPSQSAAEMIKKIQRRS